MVTLVILRFVESILSKLMSNVVVGRIGKYAKPDEPVLAVLS
jgi:hypothetical protein